MQIVLDSSWISILVQFMLGSVSQVDQPNFASLGQAGQLILQQLTSLSVLVV